MLQDVNDQLLMVINDHFFNLNLFLLASQSNPHQKGLMRDAHNSLSLIYSVEKW